MLGQVPAGAFAVQAAGVERAAGRVDQILAAPVVRCDEVAWSFAGLSMAGWNALLSAGLAVVWLAAARRAA